MLPMWSNVDANVAYDPKNLNKIFFKDRKLFPDFPSHIIKNKFQKKNS